MTTRATSRTGSADHYRALRDAAIAPYAGAIETLEAIRARGIPMALITNGEARNQRRSVEKHALEQYFHCIVIEGEFGVGKPDERVFRHALAAVGCDSRADVDGRRQPRSRHRDAAPPRHAHRLGGRDGRGLPESAPVRPHRIVRSIAELVVRHVDADRRDLAQNQSGQNGAYSVRHIASHSASGASGAASARP